VLVLVLKVVEAAERQDLLRAKICAGVEEPGFGVENVDLQPGHEAEEVEPPDPVRLAGDGRHFDDSKSLEKPDAVLDVAESHQPARLDAKIAALWVLHDAGKRVLGAAQGEAAAEGVREVVLAVEL